MTTLQAGKYVSANGLNIHYGEYGEGVPLILLHGGSATLESWDDFTPAFAQHFRVIAPDTRGHGKTINPAGELSYPVLADDVAAFIQALKLNKPLILGYSDGAQIALDLAIRYPELASGLVLGGVLYKFGALYYEALKHFGLPSAGAVDLDYIQAHASDWEEYLKASHVRADDPDYWLKFLKQISTLWWTPRDYSDDDLKKIAAPTLIFLGDRDEGIGVEHGIKMYRGIPNAELFVVPNGDHGSAGAELTNAVVMSFLTRYKPELK
jgi:pimeloyl-ACP methyl ester carboxylesterase